MTQRGAVRARVGRARDDGQEFEVVWDYLAAEDPLEIRIGVGDANSRRTRAVAVTMRTPGHDAELAVGFLLSERIVEDAGEIAEVVPESLGMTGRRLGDIVQVELRPGVTVDPGRLERNFAATSSCGVCGKASLRALGLDGCANLARVGPSLEPAIIQRLPAELRRGQSVFDVTGGLHAAALFDGDGRLLASREDVGRHNAVDKLIGARALGNLETTPARGEPLGLLVSSRIGFEIVQKALAAKIALIVAVGAPSSLAVEVAEAYGMTVLGFVGPHRFNVYSVPERVRQVGNAVAAVVEDRSA